MNGKRVALVMGNSNYGNGLVVSGEEDAKRIADVLLHQLNFTSVVTALNSGLDDIDPLLTEFKTAMADASAVVFFYSGHGSQVEGKNYLVPVDGDVTPDLALPVDTVLQALGAAPQEAVKLVFLDACRDDKRLGAGAPKGLAQPGPAPIGVIQAFAASPGQVAASGSADGLSPYTMAILKFLVEPGLTLGDFFAKVLAEVPSPQQPIFQAAALPTDFFFRDPVFVNYEIPEGKSDLLVFLRGDLVLSTNLPKKDKLRLKAGENDLLLLVSNAKAFRNNHDWDITEGWSYKMDLTLPDGTVQTFAGNEDVPFKNGPHHGKVFEVAKVNLQVDAQTAEVSLVGLDMDLANENVELFAKDQGLLFQTSIASLDLSPDDILGDALDLGSVAAILRPFLVQFLTTGTVLGQTIADPTRTFITVRGNVAFKDLAAGCMAKRDDRVRDLKASIAAAFKRDPTPFALFDQGLMACMQATPSASPSDQIRIWTALEDRSQEMPAVAAPTAVVAG